MIDLKLLQQILIEIGTSTLRELSFDLWHFFLEFNFGLFDEFSNKRISLSGKEEGFRFHPALHLLLEGLSELVRLRFQIFDFPICNIEFARTPLVPQRTDILIP